MSKRILSNLIDKITYPPDQKRLYIGASNIGSECLRQIWYEFKSFTSTPHLGRHQRNLEVGKKFESMIVDWIEKAGVTIIKPHSSNHYLEYFDDELPYFRGHADALLPTLKAVLDIKVIKASSYRDFVNKGLKEWSPIYYAQLQSYMGMGHIPHAYLLALNKDTAEIHDEKINFDNAYYKSLKERAKMIADSPSEPNRISSNPAWWLCKICKYRTICHDETHS
ncbi:MAG: hypothetical protein AB7F29_13740 [Candidatus Nitrosocosmicus sp.]